MVKLSIIIPYYNTLELTKKLLDTLIPQLTEEIEVILVDDGCLEFELDQYHSIDIIHLPTNSGNASKPRNVGLDNAKGEYITFIDSDDLVSEDYIRRILKMIYLKKDIIYLSWKSKNRQVLMTTRPPKWNCSVWCRVYKRELVENVRFKEDLKIAEDWVFNENIKPQSSCCIRRVVYFYNNGRPGSLTNGG